MILLLDNYDSFTYNLVDYFQQLGVQCRVLRNDHPVEEIVASDYQGLVVSPGPEVPGKAGNLMKLLDQYLDKIPVLGICLGHQAIGEHYGARLVKAEKPMHGKISNIKLQSDPLFNGLPEYIDVVRYNSLVLEHLPSVLRTISSSSSNEIMAIKHEHLPVWGVQFHPEAALTQYGLNILKNWLVYNNITV